MNSALQCGTNISKSEIIAKWSVFPGTVTYYNKIPSQLFEKKPLPSSSNMRVEDLHLILHGGLPTTASDIATATFENVKELLEVVEKRMSNVTELEATGRILLYVLDAVRLMPVKIKLQPGLMDHLVFTDFLIFLIDSGSDDQIPKCLIEVKKSSLNTDLKLQVPSTAQALREAHIAITHYKLSEFPFILTNGNVWSFGLAEASGEKITVTQYIHFLVDAHDMNSIKKLLYCLKCVAEGKWPKCK